MNDLTRILYNNNLPYMSYVYKSGSQLGKERRVYGEILNCAECGRRAFVSNIQLRRGGRHVCSHKCLNRKEYSANWKGGIIKKKHGYINIKVDIGYIGADKQGYVLLHRYIIQQKLGRPLRKNEVVHHIDMNPSNNSVDNLMVMNNSEHLYLHRKLKGFPHKRKDKTSMNKIGV